MNNGLAHIYGEAPAVVSQAGKHFRHQLRHVDLALSDGRTYLMGDQFTTADIILTTCLVWAIDTWSAPGLDLRTKSPWRQIHQGNDRDRDTEWLPNLHSQNGTVL